jgi:hypothetical protein
MNHESAMLAYVKLAAVSERKHQLIGRDRLLVLATAAAGRAGWIDVADRCRQLVLEHNPAHLIGRFSTAADALRSPDFTPLLNQLERMCSYERAEFLLNEQGQAEGGSSAAGEPDADAADADADEQDAGQIALALLGRRTE